MGCITASAHRISGIRYAAAGRTGGINVRCSLVCSIGGGKHLRVTPSEAQWIDVGESVTYNILSNTNWTII